MLSMSVAQSSSGMLTIGRIAYRREGGDRSAQRGRSAICDCHVFVCESNISGTAERISAKFLFGLSIARKNFKVRVKGQRSKSSGTKTRYALPSPAAATEWNALAASNVRQQQTAPLGQLTALPKLSSWWRRERLLPKNPAPLDPSVFAVRPCGPHHFRGPPQCCRRIGAYDWNVYWNVALRPK